MGVKGPHSLVNIDVIFMKCKTCGIETKMNETGSCPACDGAFTKYEGAFVDQVRPQIRGDENATTERKESQDQERNIPEYTDGNESGQAPQTGNSHSNEEGEKNEKLDLYEIMYADSKVLFDAIFEVAGTLMTKKIYENYSRRIKKTKRNEI